jgi:hypothetical protein
LKKFEETLFKLNSQFEEPFFKYFPANILVFEKMLADDIVCSSLGLNKLTRQRLDFFAAIFYIYSRPVFQK